MLKIRNLHVSIAGKAILRGLDLDVKAGEVHAIMGPNGSGKSTLANVLSGKDGYQIEQDAFLFSGKKLIELNPEERACNGLFLAFQYPVEIPGVNNMYLLKAAVNAIRSYRGEAALDAFEFLELVKEKIKLVKVNEDLLNRSVNTGFSGGEKKRNEIFQMAVLEPRLAILDETDSGLDIDALKTVAEGINSLRSKKRAFIMITHYQRLLSYVRPDYVHVLSGGRIIKSGGPKLALELEQQGYDWITSEANAA